MAVVLCYGDSNTYGADPAGGERFPPDVRWPGILRRGLGPGHTVIEEGLNGRTTIWDDPYEPGRNGRTYLLPCLLSHAPLDVIVLMLGTNDLKAIFRQKATEVARGASVLVDLILGSGCGPGGSIPRVLLIAPPHVDATGEAELWGFGDAAAESRRFGALYRRVAKGTGSAFLDAGALVVPSPLDGVHLDPPGHALLGQAVVATVLRILAAGAAGPIVDPGRHVPGQA
ncbi:MAG: SGNH/GDSL hydrolase family protein [Candidatus Limnocylindrales bacterium]